MPFARTSDTPPSRVLALAAIVGAFGLMRTLHDVALVAALGLSAASVVADRMIRRRPSHDESDRARVAAVALLAAVTAAMTAVSWSVSYEGLSHFAPHAAVVAVALLYAGSVIARDRGRLRWLSAAFANAATGWSIAPLTGSVTGLIPFVGGAPVEAALVEVRPASGPFRDEPAAPWATVPSRYAVARSRLMRRALVLVALLGLDAALLVALARHRSRAMVPMEGVAQVVVGPDQTCARLADGVVYCWGANRRHLRRDGSAGVGFDWEPVEIPALRGASELTFGGDLACGRDAAWGWRCVPRGLPARPPPWGPARPRDGSGRHECEVGADGAVRCLGDNFDGELGDGPTPPRAQATAVTLPREATDVRVERGFSCAHLGDGTAWCWGRMAWQHTGGAPLRPTAAPGLRDVAAMLVDGSRLWALRRDGTLWWWDGGPESRALAGLSSVTGFVGNRAEWCALEGTGRLWCWPVGHPADRSGVLADVTSVAAAGGHACAITRDARLRCWGRNQHGQLGDGSREARPAPTLVRR